MRHLVDNKKFGRMGSHRKALFRNLATSLILHERIETTLPKAKELRRTADRMITLGKKGSLHARRQALAYLQTPEAVAKLFDGLSARFKDRHGGYTRIFKLGFRRGDAAPMAMIEYLPGPEGRLKGGSPKGASHNGVSPKAAPKPEKAKKVKKKAGKKEGFFSRLTGHKKKED
ncbi:MAG: 50S ribosomal protein L17 [Deltaproteobacteria bacterium]|nr:50S ribosomal protein L17 [Deltaproteobacteria bacterium]